MRHAEVAGAGIAGLGIAIGLASRGWSVNVHERAPRVREIGAGIFMSHNALTVLDEYGVLERLEAEGVRLERHSMYDGNGKLLQRRVLRPPSQLLTMPRQALVDALAARAVEVGAKLETSSKVRAADPEGAITLDDGSSLQADLIVGADGQLSAVRNSLGLTRRQGPLPTVSVRYLLEGRAFLPEPESRQYWSGQRRMAITAAAPDRTYIYLSCPSGDPAEGQDDGWQSEWIEAFPANRAVLEELARHTPYVANYALVKTRSWRAGRVALIGDAAHALPPTLGQGACLALVNARSLVTYVDEPSSNVELALKRWESRVRPLTEFTQRWSCRYDRATTHCPDLLAPARSTVIHAFGRFRWLDAYMRRAGRTLPVLSTADPKPTDRPPGSTHSPSETA